MGRALAAASAVSSGQAIATGYAGTTVTFQTATSGNSETFPLTVPAGVTLTTTDSPLTTNHYAIVVAGADTTDGIVLDENAQMSGFAVGTTATTNALHCSAGIVAVSNVSLSGSAGTGLLADSNCIPSLSNATVASYPLGVALRGSGEANLSSVALTQPGIGVDIEQDVQGSEVSVTLADIGVEVGENTPPTVTLSSPNMNSCGTGFEIGAGTVTLSGATVASSGTGVEQQGGSVTANNATIGESGNGAYVLAGGSLDLLDAQIIGNEGAGISVTGPAQLTVNGSTVSMNRGPGIVFSGSTASAALASNTISLNGTAGGGGGAGIWFKTYVNLTEFTGNKIFDNDGNQVEIDAAGDWTLSSTSCGTPNQITCYAAPAVGLAASAGTVLAENVAWLHSPPTSGVDFKGSVAATSSCGIATLGCE